MMRISLSEAGKRFNRDWIFRKFSYTFQTGQSYAIRGPNGSGKSTLLQVIAGSVVSSEGNIEYLVSDQPVSADMAFRYMSLSAPYLELIEEMTAIEFLRFHEKFKPFVKHYSFDKMLAKVGLEASKHKQIRYFSSGMKQRIKLVQAIYADSPCLLLDEPCTNLDQEGIAMYQQLISENTEGRMVIVSSNDENEYGFCREEIQIQQYKLTAL